MTFCPDCEADVADESFVAHRELEHPPETMTVTITEPIRSSEAFGWRSEE